MQKTKIHTCIIVSLFGLITRPNLNIAVTERDLATGLDNELLESFDKFVPFCGLFWTGVDFLGFLARGAIGAGKSNICSSLSESVKV
mgnify:CR=1 FL=1